MFYDERIEFEKGRISRNCILLAVIVSLCLGAVQLANTLLTIKSPQFHHYMNSFLPVFIFVAGAVSLIYGLYLEKSERDERTKAESYAFYGRAAKRILILTAIFWGILLPYTMLNPMPRYNFCIIPFDYIISVLFYPICTYCVYSFKKREIYFNYSLLESEHYYRGVFKNIGKLSLWMLGIFAESFVLYGFMYISKYMNQHISDIGEHIQEMFFGWLQIFFTLATLCIVASALYLALSALEKASYKNETRLISLSTVVSFAAAACLTVIVFFITFAAARIIDALASSNLPVGFPLGSIVAAVNYIIDFINSGIYIFMLLCITYFGYEYSRVYKNRLLRGSLCVILAINAADAVISPIFNAIIMMIEPIRLSNADTMHDIYIDQELRELFLDYSYLIGFAEVVAVILIIYALIKDGTAHKGCIALICAIALALCVMIFLSTQLHSEDFSQALSLFNSFIYICLAVVVAIIGRKNIHSIDK